MVIPPANQHVPLRKEEKETTVVENVLLEEFCRKRPEPGELTHTTVGLNIKRMKTVDTQIPSVGGQDNGKMNCPVGSTTRKRFKRYLTHFRIQCRTQGGDGRVLGNGKHQPPVADLLQYGQLHGKEQLPEQHYPHGPD